MVRRLLLIGALVAAGCGGFSSGYPGPAAVRAFPVGDCDADGVEDYATALLYNDYCNPHPPDEICVVSGKSGALLAKSELGFSARHSPSVLWAGAGLETLALLDRRYEQAPAAHPLARLGCSGPTDFLAELTRSGSDGKVVGIDLRAATDGGGGVLVVVCSQPGQGSDPIVCTLYRCSHGKSAELKRYTFRGEGRPGRLVCAIGQFEGDASLDLAIGEPGSNSAAGAVHLIEGNSGAQRLLLEGAVPGGGLGAHVRALRGAHAGEVERLVLGATDSTDPGRGRGLLFACSPASPNDRIWSVEGKSDFSGIDREMQVLPDCDGDGVEDVGYIDEGEEAALIVSGRTGSRITRISRAPWQRIESIVPCADVDGDGRPDLLLAVRPSREPNSAPDPRDRQFTGCVVVSGSDGRTLRRFPVQP